MQESFPRLLVVLDPQKPSIKASFDLLGFQESLFH
jgi:hypothetical protein